QFTEIHRNRQFTLSMRRQPNPTERSEVPFSNFQIFKFSNSLKDKVPLELQHSFQSLNRIRLLNLLIVPPTQNPWEPCRDPAFVSAGKRNALKSYLENQLRNDAPNGSEFFQRVLLDEIIHLAKFGIGKA